MERFDVVIVGAGHSGAQTAIALRQRKFKGTIAIVGDEPDIPYERPPLSNDYLSGAKSLERILIRKPEYWTEAGVVLRLGHPVTGAALSGTLAPYEATPWFWSHQFNVKLQTVGLSGGYDACVIRGDPALGIFSVVYLRRGRVIALDCVNSPKDFVQGRKLVERGAIMERDILSDQSVPLAPASSAAAA